MKLIKVAVVVIAFAVMFGCSADHDDMARLMRQEGVTQFKDGGYSLFGCSDSDDFSSSFTGVKNGVPVAGYVCGGLTKGYTVRYK